MELSVGTAPRSVRMLEWVGGLAGLGGLGLVGLLPVGGTPMADSIGKALALATLPVAGGLALSSISLVVMVEQKGLSESGATVIEAIGDAMAASGRLALAAVPVLLVFASTADQHLFEAMLYGSIVMVALFAVAGATIRVNETLGASLQGQSLSWAVLGFAVICTLLARVG